MEYLLIYLMIGFLIAATLVLREVADWRRTILRLLFVTTAWLPMLMVLWFFYVLSPAIPTDEANEKEEVKS